ALVSSLDPITANRRDVQSFVDPADAERLAMVPGERPGSSLMDLPSHAIMDRGRIVGLWEFDPVAGAIVWATFDRRDDKALRDAVASTDAYVRDQLGDARSFRLDSPKSRVPRLVAL